MKIKISRGFKKHIRRKKSFIKRNFLEKDKKKEAIDSLYDSFQNKNKK